MTQKLALLGGEKTIPRPFPLYNSFGPEEAAAAQEVIQSGVLSKFIGAWTEDFFGGKKVQEFERAWEKAFAVKHAVSMNSATSGLMAALGAVGVAPGDEVIVSPWTMSASATAILVWQAIPVFADIEPDTFNLDPAAVEKAITPRTTAIVVPDIFGHGAELDAILKIARKHGLKVIEDAAQAPGALYHGKFVGTLADVGVYSLNYHKHIHTGEGGVCVTNDPKLAERMQLIRNHAEAVAAKKEVESLDNLVGFNFRLGEIEAAMGLAQLRKLPGFAGSRTHAGSRLNQKLSGLKGLSLPITRRECSHVYYVYGMKYDAAATGVKRERVIEALRAEGVPGVMQGYANIHLLPIYQKRIAFGKKGYPWTSPAYEGSVSYEKGICPVAEGLHDRSFIGIQLCMHHYDDKETDAVAAAFLKVWGQLDALKG